MSRERYNPNNDTWSNSNGATPYEMAEAIYQQVGARFHIRWKRGKPSVDFNNLPDGVTEQDVRQAISDNVN